MTSVHETLFMGDFVQGRTIPNYPSNPFVVRIGIPAPRYSAVGLIVADLNADGRMDYRVTVAGHVAAYRWDGRKLWVLKVDVRADGSAEPVHQQRGRNTENANETADSRAYCHRWARPLC
jgi:hypothetical protein